MTDSPMMFERINRPGRLPDEVARIISQAIDTRQLKPGDRLPTEEALSKRFGVARTVVREAISLLKYDGIILSRQGVGAFIGDVSYRKAFRISPACFEKRKQLVQLLQLRTGVQADAAALAATSHSDTQMKIITGYLEEMTAAVGMEPADVEHRIDSEAAFYHAITEASGNDYYVEFIGMIETQVMENLRTVVIKNAFAAECGARVLAEHRAVYEGINNADPKAAREATRQHFEQASKRLADRADFADV